MIVYSWGMRWAKGNILGLGKRDVPWEKREGEDWRMGMEELYSCRLLHGWRLGG
jgi:hypothetical protein